MLFNINNYIRVKLTECGRRILKREHDSLMKLLPESAQRPFEIMEDEDGWYKGQAWSIISTFGSHMRMGGDPPFETEIDIVSMGGLPTK